MIYSDCLLIKINTKRLISKIVLRIFLLQSVFFLSRLKMDTFSSDPALSKLLTDMEKFSEDMKKFNQRLDFYDESLKVSIQI